MHAYAFSNPRIRLSCGWISVFIVDSFALLVDAAYYIGCGALRRLRASRPAD